MERLNFKTNIKCAGCVAKVTPHLNAVEGIAGNWQVDIYNPSKVLTVQADKVPTSQIKEAVQNAGFTIEQDVNEQAEGPIPACSIDCQL